MGSKATIKRKHFDLNKAFDTNNQKILLLKMKT